MGLSHVHVIGGIKFVQGEQIDDLPVDHVFGTDDTAYSPVYVLRNGRKIEVESEIGLLQISREVQHGTHGNGRAVQVLFGGETLVEVFEIGCEGIVGFDIEVGVLRSSYKRYAAARLYRKVFCNEVLQAEIVIPFIDRVSAV